MWRNREQVVRWNDALEEKKKMFVEGKQGIITTILLHPTLFCKFIRWYVRKFLEMNKSLKIENFLFFCLLYVISYSYYFLWRLEVREIQTYMEFGLLRFLLPNQNK